MFLTKDGITIEVSHPSDIDRYKRLGYVQVKDAPTAVEETKPPEKTPEQLAAEQQAKDQVTVEEVVQPEKKGKVKK